VKNVGSEDILYMNWVSRLNGRLLFVPSERSYHGAILYLGPGEELVIQQIGLLFGFGVLEVNVTVGTTFASVKGLMVLFWFFPR
jgi:hypothetical protein